MRRCVGMLAVLLALAGAGLADATELVPRAIAIKLHGRVGSPQANERVIAELTLRRETRTIRFQVREIWVLSGDAMDVDILHEVEPYTPNMTLTGPPGLADRLEKAAPDEMLELIGYFRRGSRLLSLSSVEPVKAK